MSQQNETILKKYQHHLRVELKSRQIATRLSCLRYFIRFLGKNQLKEMKNKILFRHLRKYREHLLLKVEKEKIKKSSARTFIMYVRALLHWLKKPVPTDFKITKIPHKIGVFLSREEMKNIEKYMNRAEYHFDNTDKMVIRLLLQTGMRLSELINIKLSDVNLKECYIKVFGKGEKERLITIPNVLLKSLKRYIIYRKSPKIKRLTHKKFNNILLVKAWYNKNKYQPLYPRYIQRLVKRLELENTLTPHAMRRTYATWLLQDGVPLPDVSSNLGHANKSTTLNYYTMPTKEGAAKISSAMEKFYRKNRKR